MGAARLILIEGMIGSDKTTTATRVGDWLARRGEHVRVFCECAADHPIRTRAEDRLRAAAGPQAPGPGSAGDGGAAGSTVAYAAAQWRRLAEQCLRDRQTIIVESSFLQNSVMPAFIDGAPARTATEVFTRIVRQAAPARPLLVYLRPADIAAAIARIHRARGEPWSSRNVAFVENSPWARSAGVPGMRCLLRHASAQVLAVVSVIGPVVVAVAVVTAAERLAGREMCVEMDRLRCHITNSRPGHRLWAR